MFKLRLITTIILLPLAIAGILYLPTIYIAVLSGIVIAMAAWEWLNMVLLKDTKTKFFLLVALIALTASLLVVGIYPILYYFALIWWVLAFIGICYYPKYAEIWKQFLFQPVVGLVLFVPSWMAFNTLHEQFNGPVWVLLGCALIWGADIGAYCCGRLWGKAKLAPAVSPNKTRVGLYGAFITGLVIMSLFYYTFQPPISLRLLLLLSVVTVAFSVIGDLFESMLKRIYGVKDSGKIIPGHGGVLDRIDSMLAAFPAYFIMLEVIQRF